MSQPTVRHDLDRPALRRLAAGLSAGAPVIMLNLLKFREVAIYEEPRTDLPPCTGRAAYLTRYIPAFEAAMARYGEASVVFAGDVLARLAGAGGEWDAVALVSYPDIHSFAALMADPDYLRDASPHRSAALADWGFFATQTISTSG